MASQGRDQGQGAQDFRKKVAARPAKKAAAKPPERAAACEPLRARPRRQARQGRRRPPSPGSRPPSEARRAKEGRTPPGNPPPSEAQRKKSSPPGSPPPSEARPRRPSRRRSPPPSGPRPRKAAAVGRSPSPGNRAARPSAVSGKTRRPRPRAGSRPSRRSPTPASCSRPSRRTTARRSRGRRWTRSATTCRRRATSRTRPRPRRRICMPAKAAWQSIQGSIEHAGPPGTRASATPPGSGMNDSAGARDHPRTPSPGASLGRRSKAKRPISTTRMADGIMHHHPHRGARSDRRPRHRRATGAGGVRPCPQRRVEGQAGLFLRRGLDRAGIREYADLLA